MPLFIQKLIVIKLLFLLLFLAPTKSMYAQREGLKVKHSFVVDSLHIGNIFYEHGTIKTSRELASAIDSLIDSISLIPVKIMGLKNFDFAKYSTQFIQITNLKMTTREMLIFKAEHVPIYSELLELDGFYLENFDSMLDSLITRKGGGFLLISRCKINKFNNWSISKTAFVRLQIDKSYFIDPSFVNIHNDIRSLIISNSNITHIDSDDIYKLEFCEFPNNKISNPPIIPIDFVKLSTTIDFSGNPLKDLTFISSNFPKAVKLKYILIDRKITNISY